MPTLLALLLLSITSQGLATALRNHVHSLVGKKLGNSLAIINEINEVDGFKRNALHHAVMLGDLPLVEFFLANGVDTKAIDNDGLIPLRYAEQLAEEQPSVERMQIASLVLEKTRGVNKGDAKGLRPIGWSILAGDYPRITELLAKDADILSGRTRGQQLAGRHNAVWVAEHLQDDRAIKILAEASPDKYFPPAVANGYRNFTQAMIARGIDVNVRDDNNYTAIMHAAKAGRVAEVQMLIDLGAKVDNDTLILAAYSGNPKLVQMILEYDVDVNAIANRSVRSTTTPSYWRGIGALTALEMVLLGESKLPKVSKGRRKIIRILFEHGAKIGFVTGNFQQLIPKIIAGNASAMADLSTLWQLHQKQRRSSVLEVVVATGDPVAMKKMLSYLPDADSFLPQGIAALARANINNKNEMAEMLIEHASNIGIDKNKFVDDANSLQDLSATYRPTSDNTFRDIIIEAIKKIAVNDVQKLIEYGAVPERSANLVRDYNIHTLTYLTKLTSALSKNEELQQVEIMKMLANFWQEDLPLAFAVAKGDHRALKEPVAVDRYNDLDEWQESIRVVRLINDDEALSLLLSHPQITEHLEQIASTAIKNDDYELLNLAIDNGADVDGVNLYNPPIPLLALAAGKNNLPMVELLLAHNSDPNFTHARTVTPIIAVVNEFVMLNYLYDYVVSRAQKNTAETRVKIIEKLVAAGAEINASHRGRTALDSAIMLYDVELVEALIRLGADRSHSQYSIHRARLRANNKAIGSKKKQETLLARLQEIEQLLQP